MKKVFYGLLVALSFLTLSMGSASAATVKGYRKKNGTYVQSYHRTSPNKTKRDNYSTKGNTNPYTGKKGTKSPTYKAPKHKSTKSYRHR